MSSNTFKHGELDFEVLDFFHDDEGSCALTVLHNNTRFHLIADAQKLNASDSHNNYRKLIKDVKHAEEKESTSASIDSGVELGEDVDAGSTSAEDAEEVLQRWMLQHLREFWEVREKKISKTVRTTLREWYSLPTYFFNLERKRGKVHAIELEPDGDLQSRVDGLTPQISIPKYIRDIDVPTFSAGDLTVLSCSHSPPPYHPTRVRARDGRVYFFKTVDPSQPQPTKREISLLNRITKKGLHDSIKCPRLEGLVTWDNDRSKIMGFLQTDIPQPTPLTLKLDADISQELRDSWADESRRMKDVLHDHGIVWGDAKADNFMIDEHNQLWIIDFGGSYTEGWVDPEIKETEKGDDMGVEKIANALHDPVANTWDPDTEKSFGGSHGAEEEESKGNKRTYGRSVEGDKDVADGSRSERSRKRRRSLAE